MIQITNEDIRADIKAFEKRINAARDKLEALPDKVYGWKQEKALNKKRNALLSEIAHVQGLISIAREALPDEG